ncbi:hypothetical protein QZH41_020333, partial [Actinostola sp. cb2023]
QFSHTTQTSPLRKSFGDQQTLFEEIPGNVRHESRTSPQYKQSGFIEAKMSRQPTPLTGTLETGMVPGHNDQKLNMCSESNSRHQFEGASTRAGNVTSKPDLSRSQDEQLQNGKCRHKSKIDQTSAERRQNLNIPNPLPSHQGPVITQTSALLNDTSKMGSTQLPRVIPQHSQASDPIPVGLTAGQQSHQPSFHFLTNGQKAQERLPMSQIDHNQPCSRHPPPIKSMEHDLPVYVNKMYDISVSRPGIGRLLVNDNRSQSDTSQSFSAELDAVYRLYCHEYELQLQLQQQQLELQKQQLQLQQQLQQLELFQQRQQSHQPVAGPVRQQQQPSTPVKTIIRETPSPTPAPQPSAQPLQVTPLDDLVPTPDDTCISHQGHSASIKDNGRITEEERQSTQTIRRITSSKRPKYPKTTFFFIHTRDQPGYYGNGYHGDSDGVIEPWVSRSNFVQKDSHHEPELDYPFEIVDLLQEMKDEPTISNPSKKPSYAVYHSSPVAELGAVGGVMDSTDSGYSHVSRDVSEHRSPLTVSVGSDNETDNEELNVLEDIFFIQ